MFASNLGHVSKTIGRWLTLPLSQVLQGILYLYMVCSMQHQGRHYIVPSFVLVLVHPCVYYFYPQFGTSGYF
jgi:hypothetical protein